MTLEDICFPSETTGKSHQTDTHQTRNLKRQDIQLLITHPLSEPLKAFAHKLSTTYTPNTVEEALKDP